MRRDDTGSAIVEFCFLGVLLMVPLAYVVLAVFHVQAAAYGAAAATRESGRAYTTTPAGGDAEGRAWAAAGVALADHGVDLADQDYALTCSADPCSSPGGTVRTTIAVDVPLPLLPRFLGDAATFRVEATHVQPVDRFRGAP
ncbi:pilus assembly protein [Vallicoccus soli]|uniref:Pilus assembly protein n=1 Tax=Vallicoccus soli TaxID=2339232 RepID=A0A3A3YXG4_9ACTN|nr:pilus assembly protein [Vallicoccus soli]RJK96369.1 pilus assembly protein [Vallicoccus soli]